MQHSSKFLIAWLILFSFPSEAVEFQGTRSVALSEALRGAVSLNEGIYHNPASFAFSERYSIEAQSSVLPSHKQEPNTTWIFGGSAVDSHSPLFSAGLGYYRKSKEAERGDDLENATHLALSKRLSEKISVGLTGKYIHRTMAEDEKAIFDGDVGAFLVLTPAVQLGAVIQNGAASDEAFERAFGIGSRIQAWDFLYLNADLLKKIEGTLSKNISLHTGMEVVHKTGVVFQMGVSAADRSQKNGISLGLGWGEHKVGASYAFQKGLDGTGRSTHALSLRIFF